MELKLGADINKIDVASDQFKDSFLTLKLLTLILLIIFGIAN